MPPHPGETNILSEFRKGGLNLLLYLLGYINAYAYVYINGRFLLTKRSISTLLAKSLLLRSSRMLDAALNRRSQALTVHTCAGCRQVSSCSTGEGRKAILIGSPVSQWVSILRDDWL